MDKQNNLISRAFNALVEGRQRQAQRYVAEFERTHAHLRNKNTDR
ncbi:hypothetical protein SAMN05216456_1029 [Devosia crocina]|uniref:Uncharacterized protein n=1 Tax=Devosia crocina TaxID=429728 RepID=A0A1I7N741_9HYPH|nr:hypothetical protein [Devosia crocina]SFV30474.1 hypothetical protein SAMN05216456_1029 [Devosia crocina]